MAQRVPDDGVPASVPGSNLRHMSLLRPAAPRHPDPEPLELDDTRVVLLGTVLWAAGLVVLVVLDLVGVRVPGWWLQMCLAGIALGLVGLRVLARRKAAARRRPPPSAA